MFPFFLLSLLVPLSVFFVLWKIISIKFHKFPPFYFFSTAYPQTDTVLFKQHIISLFVLIITVLSQEKSNHIIDIWKEVKCKQNKFKLLHSNYSTLTRSKETNTDFVIGILIITDSYLKCQLNFQSRSQTYGETKPLHI